MFLTLLGRLVKSLRRPNKDTSELNVQSSINKSVHNSEHQMAMINAAVAVVRAPPCNVARGFCTRFHPLCEKQLRGGDGTFAVVFPPTLLIT